MPPKINDGLTNQQRYRLKNTVKVREINKQNARMRRENPLTNIQVKINRAESQYRCKYRISRTDALKLRAIQNNQCGACGGLMDDVGAKRWVVDHFMRDGKPVVRGILHMSCNAGLGQFEHCPEFLRRAASYLETV